MELCLGKYYGIIYKIINKINGKVYIGQTISRYGFNGRYCRKGKGIERVYGYYMSNKRNNKDYNDHLLNSIEKYGFENFEVEEIFDTANSKFELDMKEIYYIDYYNSMDSNYGYNNQRGGNDLRCNDETKRKISQSRIGKYYGKDNPNYGNKWSEEKKKEFSQSRKGKNSPLYGKYGTNIRSEEYLKKVICLNTLEVFICIADAGRKYNIDGTNITSCCKNSNGCISAGKDKNNYNMPLVWRYYEDYLNMTEEDIQNALDKVDIRVIRLDTLTIYDSPIIAQNKTNIGKSNILRSCKNIKKNSAGKNEFGNKIYWMYYKDYIKMFKEGE